MRLNANRATTKTSCYSPFRHAIFALRLLLLYRLCGCEAVARFKLAAFFCARPRGYRTQLKTAGAFGDCRNRGRNYGSGFTKHQIAFSTKRVKRSEQRTRNSEVV